VVCDSFVAKAGGSSSPIASTVDGEFCDLATDRTETNDLAAKHPERVKSMRATWTAWAVKTGVAK
jgi:hypothetical protein